MSDLQRRLTSALGDRYTIEGRLGTGATAVVLLARDLKHDRQVALKVLRPEFAQSLGTERFLREIRLVAGFTHPHILPLHDSGEADGLLYYTMPLARGGSLRTRLAQERQLPVTDAVRIAYQVASALAYAHARGVVHRDIKPENILLEEGQVLLADFGLARGNAEATTTALTDPGLAVGTPIYMSPEQAAGMAVDGRSDVYALGCVLFEMLDGEPPFTGRSADIVLARHRTEAPRSLDVSRPGLPVPLRHAVMRALAKVPADRFSSASAFADAIRAASDGVLSTPGGIPAAAPVQPRRWRDVATALAVLAIPAAIVVRGFTTKANEALRKDALDPRQVAVLFFDRAPKADAIADGLTEELIDRLSDIAALRVLSVDGARAVRDERIAPDSVARRFGTGTVVTGSVRPDRDSMRVTMRVMDGNDGRQRSSLSLVVPRIAIGSLGQRIAEELSDSLRRQIGNDVGELAAREGAKDALAWEFASEAHRLWWDGGILMNEGEVGRASLTLARADSLYERASDRDPTWSEPWIGRGWLRAQDAFNALGSRPIPVPRIDRATREAIGFANRGLRLAPDSSAGLELRAAARWIRWHALDDEKDVQEAELDLLRATALKPGFAAAWRRLGDVYFDTGRFAEASVADRHALTADAFMREADQVTARLMHEDLELERFGEASKRCTEGQARYRGQPNFVECGLLILSRQARGPRAIESSWRENAIADSLPMLRATRGVRLDWVAAVLARSGLRDSALQVMQRAAASTPKAGLADLALYDAFVHLELGDRDAALGSLARHLESAPRNRRLVSTTAMFRALRDDDRFVRLVRQGP